MKVTAFVLDDLTAFIGDREVLEEYMKYNGRSRIYHVKDVIDIEVPISAIKKVYRCVSENVKKIILGRYVQEIIDPYTNEVVDEYYDNPLHVVFDSDTYNSYRNQLTKIIEA